MSEHQKQTEFFKAFTRNASTPAQRQLRDRILEAEGDIRCCRRAMLKVLALVAISFVAGLYTVVIMPEVLHQHNHIVKRGLEILTVGSVLSFASYAGFWLYYRAVLFQVHSEYRRLLVSMLARDNGRSEAATEFDMIPAH